MQKEIQKKICPTCQKEFIRIRGIMSDKQWKLRVVCSAKCWGPFSSKINKGKRWALGHHHSKETKMKMRQAKLDLNLTKYFGDRDKYRRLHLWVEKQWGKPSECEHCHRTGLYGRFIHWANKSDKYLKIRSDWMRLCAKCHIFYHYRGYLPQTMV